MHENSESRPAPAAPGRDGARARQEPGKSWRWVEVDGRLQTYFDEGAEAESLPVRDAVRALWLAWKISAKRPTAG
jgi:hypothetical protein